MLSWLLILKNKLCSFNIRFPFNIIMIFSFGICAITFSFQSMIAGVIISSVGAFIALINAIISFTENQILKKVQRENEIYKQNNEDLQMEIDELNEILTNLSKVEEDLRIENNEYHTNNHTLKKQNIKLSKAIEALRITHDQLLDILDCNKDELKKHNKNIEKNIGTLREVSEELKLMMNKLVDAKFSDIDKDGDGFITKKEFRHWRKVQLKKQEKRT